jgi:hypothetical protein
MGRITNMADIAEVTPRGRTSKFNSELLKRVAEGIVTSDNLKADPLTPDDPGVDFADIPAEDWTALKREGNTGNVAEALAAEVSKLAGYSVKPKTGKPKTSKVRALKFKSKPRKEGSESKEVFSLGLYRPKVREVKSAETSEEK